MNTVKSLFSVMLLGIAVWLLDRFLPDWASLLGWSVLLISVSFMLGIFDGPRTTFGGRLAKGAAIFPMVWTCILIVSVASGGSSPLRPLAHLVPSAEIATPTATELTVTDIDTLKREVLASEKPVFVHVSADWCASCQTMKSRYKEPAVAKTFREFTVIEADVTENTADSQKILTEFDAFGPPAMVVYKANDTTQFKVAHGELSELELINFLKSLNN
jgi:thiol:disulfide interchange protein DsbD